VLVYGADPPPMVHVHIYKKRTYTALSCCNPLLLVDVDAVARQLVELAEPREASCGSTSVGAAAWSEVLLAAFARKRTTTYQFLELRTLGNNCWWEVLDLAPSHPASNYNSCIMRK
jgi:hypothetical protein